MADSLATLNTGTGDKTMTDSLATLNTGTGDKTRTDSLATLNTGTGDKTRTDSLATLNTGTGDSSDSQQHNDRKQDKYRRFAGAWRDVFCFYQIHLLNVNNNLHVCLC